MLLVHNKIRSFINQRFPAFTNNKKDLIDYKKTNVPSKAALHCVRIITDLYYIIIFSKNGHFKFYETHY